MMHYINDISHDSECPNMSDGAVCVYVCVYIVPKMTNKTTQHTAQPMHSVITSSPQRQLQMHPTLFIHYISGLDLNKELQLQYNYTK